jgi:type I restriction enzyme, S subunit
MNNDLNETTLANCLEHIIDYRGKTPKKLGEEWKTTGVRAISANNVSFGGLRNLETIRYADDILYQKWMKEDVKKGDLLLTSEAPAGRVMVWNSDEKIVLSQRLYCLRVKDNVDNWYLKYYLQSSTGQKEIEKNNSGSTVFGISVKTFKNIKVRFPNKTTQENIGRVLSALDAKIKLNQRINAELEAMAKTLYNYWFVQFDFPDESGNPYKSSGGKMVWNEQLKREIPEGWGAGTLDALGTIIGGSTPSRKKSEYFSQNNMAWITPKDLSLNAGKKFITKGELDVSEAGIKSASLKIMPKGTILLSSRAPIGYMAISREEVTTNQGFKSFIPDKGYSAPFVYYTVQSAIPTIINHSSGSTFKEASATVLKSIRTFLPPTSITNKFEDVVTAIFERQNKLELESQTLTELRDWLLPMLMNGQVMVGNLDSDENKRGE